MSREDVDVCAALIVGAAALDEEEEKKNPFKCQLTLPNLVETRFLFYVAIFRLKIC